MSYKKYLMNKLIIGYGIINGIINAIIFYLIHMSHFNGLMLHEKALEDLCLTTLLLGMILAWCVVPLTKKDLAGNKFVPGVAPACFKKMPKGTFLIGCVVGIVTLIIGGAASWLVLLPLGAEMSYMTVLLIKGLMCTLVGALAGYLVISTVVAQLPIEE